MTGYEYLTDLELIRLYGERCADVERASEHGASERRELELRVERDRYAAELLRRLTAVAVSA